MLEKQEIFDLIDEANLAEAFTAIDEFKSANLKSYPVYSDLKRDFILTGIQDGNFYDRLKTLVSVLFEEFEEKNLSKPDNKLPKYEEQRKTILIGGLEFEFVLVESGTFQMGYLPDRDGAYFDWLSHSLPTKKQNIDSFWLGKTLLSQDQWKLLLGDNPSKFKGGNLPVENISLHDCHAFLVKLREKTGKNFRLPSELEWDYAARGGNQTKNFKYAGSNDLNEVAWYKGNTNQTKPLCTKKPNELGIYDLTGNVWEWTDSGWSENYESPRTLDRYVLRGGAWFNDYDDSRLVVRTVFEPAHSDDGRGMRLAISNL